MLIKKLYNELVLKDVKQYLRMNYVRVVDVSSYIKKDYSLIKNEYYLIVNDKNVFIVDLIIEDNYYKLCILNNLDVVYKNLIKFNEEDLLV